MISCLVGPGPGALAVPRVTRGLDAAGHRVEVVLEERARSFVGPAAFASHAAVVEEPSPSPAAALYAPACPGVLARLARGLAHPPPGARSVLVAPELDAATAAHPAVRENLGLLERRGFAVVRGEGDQMAPPGEILARTLGALGGPLEGLRVLVTAGGTREPIDGVRFIGNRSSGKMGLALARAALRLGAGVCVVAANVAGREPGVGWVEVETVQEMREEVLRRAGRADALVMAAAVSDFTPAERVGGKIRRRDAGEYLLRLRPTADILREVRERFPRLFVVGFAATHGDPVSEARRKLREKGADLVVGNDVFRAGIGFGADENEVWIVGPDDERFVPRSSKDEVARAILDVVKDHIERKRRETDGGEDRAHHRLQRRR
ncbi:Phosphopantothenoylcysteine decarboxylase / Phosphopantothenate-cysteine ligase [Rubrobacter xylanophilus DSM 9941]|uniref:Coenzyme A biosynthesis bifunctional protein CoaBC n=1 Tax=Rubrobacter xylanophilus (strain DSM 9941 / JCM 11954 / NBRC 16129 / PRD-1) TaxID=266117 RepID=Q1AVZ5_RUBXD|nr:phosphopantothenoylcysteine decarboxylase [Rubrobacter xylanophilus]ABG04433.1 Phosphopantothenoylcysteine decarboxylase / Phosphopantothenate-cysteine ligase [Rubrobacter xylanophilus DSM 9941]